MWGSRRLFSACAMLQCSDRLEVDVTVTRSGFSSQQVVFGCLLGTQCRVPSQLLGLQDFWMASVWRNLVASSQRLGFQ